MTLSTTTSRISYAGNGATVAFSFPYYFLVNADLIVNLLDASGNPSGNSPQVITTDYSVSGAGVQAGGTVTMVVAPPSGYTLVIYRDPVENQDLHLVENDDLPAAELEKRYDKLTMLAQRLSDRLGRAMVLPDSFAATFSTILPNVLTALYVIRVNAAGNAFELVVMSAGKASDISVATISGLTATNVQTAIAELLADTQSLATVTGSRGTPTQITAVGGITPAGKNSETIFIKGNGGAVTVTANPQIAAGVSVGNLLRLVGRDGTNTVTLANGTGLALNGGCVLGASSVLSLLWDGTNWVEVSRNDL